MSNEVKVALLAIAAIGLSYWGYNFIIGKNILKKSNIYYVAYDNIGGMKPSIPVQIRGYDVGFVSEIRLSDDYQQVVVTLDLQKEIQISPNTTAAILSDGFMGGKIIELRNSDCSQGNCAQSGDYINGELVGLVGSMVSESEFEQYVKILEDGLSNLIDTINQKLISDDADSPIGKMFTDLEKTMGNVESSTRRLDGLLRQSSDDISGSMANLRSISDNLEKNNATITRILTNADKMTAQLSDGDLETIMTETKTAIESLQTTLASADEALSYVSAITGKLNQGEGTLGKLLQDEKLYEQLMMLSGNLDSLMEDLNERPYRYVPFKNRKKVLRYDRQDEKLESNGN
jgi:phospholipid/cholesterol/gamma-HCH transport system substrate-binding protein